MPQVIRAVRERKGNFPVSIARVNSENVVVKKATDKYTDSSKADFFAMMKKIVVMKDNVEETIFHKAGGGELASIVLPVCVEAHLKVEFDSNQYKFLLKTDKSEHQRCVLGFTLSDQVKSKDISNIKEANFPDQLSCIEVTSTTKAKQLRIPTVVFEKGCTVKLSCKDINKKKLGSHCGLNFSLDNDLLE